MTTGTRPETHERLLRVEAEQLRARLGSIATAEEATYEAALWVAGPIRDTLQTVMHQMDAMYEFLEARGVWDEE